VALILFAIVSQAVHNFEHHHHHGAVKICDAKTGEEHFHDADYFADDCTLCDFTFSAFEYAPILGFPVLNPKIEPSKNLFDYPNLRSLACPIFTPARAPPFSILTEKSPA
jgi:hypothetical protein